MPFDSYLIAGLLLPLTAQALGRAQHASQQGS